MTERRALQRVAAAARHTMHCRCKACSAPGPGSACQGSSCSGAMFMAAPVHLAAAKAPMHTPSQQQAASLEAAGSGLLTFFTTSMSLIFISTLMSLPKSKRRRWRPRRAAWPRSKQGRRSRRSWHP